MNWTWLPRDARGRVLIPAGGERAVGTLSLQLRRASAPRPHPAIAAADLHRLRREMNTLIRNIGR